MALSNQFNKNKTNHPISRISHPSATANTAIHHNNNKSVVNWCLSYSCIRSLLFSLTVVIKLYMSSLFSRFNLQIETSVAKLLSLTGCGKYCTRGEDSLVLQQCCNWISQDLRLNHMLLIPVEWLLHMKVYMTQHRFRALFTLITPRFVSNVQSLYCTLRYVFHTCIVLFTY